MPPPLTSPPPASPDYAGCPNSRSHTDTGNDCCCCSSTKLQLSSSSSSSYWDCLPARCHGHCRRRPLGRQRRRRRRELEERWDGPAPLKTLFTATHTQSSSSSSMSFLLQGRRAGKGTGAAGWEEGEGLQIAGTRGARVGIPIQ